MRIRQGYLLMSVTNPWGRAMNLLLDTYHEVTGKDELGALMWR